MLDNNEVPLFDMANYSNFIAKNPLPMQYLGSKSRIASWIIDEINKEFPFANTFIDLFSGTGSISIIAKDFFKNLIINDVQPYTLPINKSLFEIDRNEINGVINSISELSEEKFLLANGRESFKEYLEIERYFFKNIHQIGFDWKQYENFNNSFKLINGTEKEIKAIKNLGNWNLFSFYYLNTYFGVEQCLQLDTLREFIDTIPFEDAKTHILASVITAMTFTVSSTTHLAQYLKPTSRISSENLLKKRKKNLIEEVIKRLENLKNSPRLTNNIKIYQLDYLDALDEIDFDQYSVVYVDPPYFKEHYSRYYHVLDTYYLYDYPRLSFNKRLNSTTTGRYRTKRYVSDFGLKSSVEKAFNSLFNRINKKKSNVVISYANTSLINKEKILQLADQNNLYGIVKEKNLMHSGQGQPRNKNVIEFLFLFKSSGENHK